MRRLRVHIGEVPKVIVRRLCLRDFIVRFRLARVDKFGELDGVLDEEDRDVVPDDVPVALLCVELDSEAANITNSVRRASAAEDGGESDEDRGLAGCVRQDASAGDIFGGFVEFECPKGTGTAGVDDTLGDAFMIEAVDLSWC